MNNDTTRPIRNKETVLYRCSCGNQITLDTAAGGRCEACQKLVSAKALQHDLAATITLGTMPQSARVDLNGTAADVESKTDPNLLIGRSFGHYEIISHLGQGGMGHVYRALDKSLQRYVAVKVLMNIDQSPTDKPDRQADLLLQEAVAQARVQHPNIVTIYFVGKQNNEPFLAMEMISGQPLSQKIEQCQQTGRHFEFYEMAKITSQIVAALQFSHELDVIHGDIKPSNILINHSGTVKLSDFGMARRTTDRSEKMGGTPNYLAPEVLKGHQPSIQSDMYALGVTLYQLTFGRLPIELTGSTVLDWQKCHEIQKLEFPSRWPEHLPDRWRDLLERLLAPKPKDRYPNYDQLKSEIDKMRVRSNAIAGPVPRMIAAFFDWSSVLVFMMPIRAALDFAEFESFFARNPLIAFLAQLVDLVPMAIYLAVVFVTRQSLGRRLMQIRVVNKYGMAASSRTMVLRSLPRMIIPLVTTLLLFFAHTETTWGIVMASTIGFIATLVWLFDSAAMLIYHQGRSLHDLFFDTRVVLDIEETS